MGLFGGSKGKTRPRGGTTIIADGTRLTGDLDLSGNLHIDGHVEGRIDSGFDVSVGASGSLEGDIRAQRIVVSGMIRGRVDCGRLEIVDKGRVFGEVSSKEFVIEPGGQFVGESRTASDEVVKALDHHGGELSDGASGGDRKSPSLFAVDDNSAEVEPVDVEIDADHSRTATRGREGS